jgi:protein-S-isoprenylcysteine O-methyltransferase Ste14
MDTLTRKSYIGLIQLLVAMALLLFLPAGSLSFWQGWVYWFLFSICVIAITLYFLKYDPHLVEGRLVAGPRAEQRTSQKVIQAIAAMLFFAVMIVPGLDYRFHWSRLPVAIIVLGDILVVLSLAMIFLCLRQTAMPQARSKSKPSSG